jgi:archaemetzincin
MKVITYLLPAVALTVLGSCKNQRTELLFGHHRAPVIIDIQPFRGVDACEYRVLYTSLKKVYPSVQLKAPVDLPASAYYHPRNRYRADSLINYLRQQTYSGHVTIGVTNRDISTSKGKVIDWGVMGLGLCPGNACVVSGFRLKKEAAAEQLYKVAVHELGHTFGLPHCSDPHCYMRDADGENPTDEENDFCSQCKPRLKKAGWIL